MSVTLTIDGNPVSVQEGTTILEAARTIGIEIPHFCYHPCLSIPANCRMCLVEVEKSPRLLPACHAKAAAGMNVHTGNERVLRTRQAIMEFMFINHPVDCPVCDQSGECKLQDYFMAWQKRLSRFQEKKVVKKKAVPIGPRVMYDAERCILCTRCIRFMREIAGNPQLCMVERGDHSYISTAPGEELDDQYSLNAAEICPVGALTSRDFRFRKRVWFLQSVQTVCPGCARGCSILLQQHQGTVYRYLSRENPQVNDAWLCDDGRLSYHTLNDGRLTECTVNPACHSREGGNPDTSAAWVPACAGTTTKNCKLHEGENEGEGEKIVSPQEAAKVAVKLLLQYKDKSTLVVSPQLTCEEIWALLKFCRDILGVKEFFVSGRPAWDGDALLRLPDANPNRRGLREIALALGMTCRDLMPGSMDGIDAGSLLFVAGNDLPCPLPLEKFGPVISLTAHAPGIAVDADIALPLAAFSEQEGIFVNADGLVQRTHSTGMIKGDAIPAWRWVTYFEWALGRELSYKSAEGVFSEIARKVPFFTGMTHESIKPTGTPGAGVVPAERGRLCRRR